MDDIERIVAEISGPKRLPVGLRQIGTTGNIPVHADPKSVAYSGHPALIRGALRGRHERWVRDAVDAGGAADESANLRTAKSCGPDAPTLAFKSRGSIHGATVTTKPGHRGEREGNR